jgi:Tol biopolymer transport system component
LSLGGTLVAFESDATNLVAGDANGLLDVFVHDRTTGTTRLVSVSATGVQGNTESANARLSGDGRYVAFESWTDVWDPADQNGWLDVYVKDLATGALERASVDSAGLEGQHASQDAVLSADGRFVAFTSRAVLAPGDANLFVPDVYVRDRIAGTTELVSVDSAGLQGLGVSGHAALSGDGRWVAFETTSRLVPIDTNRKHDVYVRDRQLGITVLVSIEPLLGVGNDRSFGPAISADGRFVAFESDASNMDFSGDANGTRDVFLYDTNLGFPTRISVGPGFLEANGFSSEPALGQDGRFVAYESAASNLVAGDVNARADVFVFDVVNTTTHRASVTADDRQGDEGSGVPALSGDGSVIAFASRSGFDPFDAGHFEDVFVRDGVPRASAYCFGDGSGAACPCGNEARPFSGRGCRNSLGDGARLFAHGTPSAGADTLVLVATGMPNATAVFVQGMLVENDGAGRALHDGLLCVSGTLVRLRAKPVALGTAFFPAAGEPAISALGGALPGHTRNYQVFYRNAAAFCSPGTANSTNAVQLTWTF